MWGKLQVPPFHQNLGNSQTKRQGRTEGAKSGNLRGNQELSQPIKTWSLWREGPDTSQLASAVATLYEPDSKTERVQCARIRGHDGSRIFLRIMIHNYCF